MSYIKTWVERCDEHPDHKSGMVSNGMIQARMQEEIDDLRAENEKLRADNERLFNEDTKTRHALKGWVFVCPDGGDEPTHERVAAVVAEVEKLRSEIERLREVIRTIRARCVELDDSDAVSETLDIATAVLEDEP